MIDDVRLIFKIKYKVYLIIFNTAHANEPHVVMSTIRPLCHTRTCNKQKQKYWLNSQETSWVLKLMKTNC